MVPGGVATPIGGLEFPFVYYKATVAITTAHTMMVTATGQRTLVVVWAAVDFKLLSRILLIDKRMS